METHFLGNESEKLNRLICYSAGKLTQAIGTLFPDLHLISYILYYFILLLLLAMKNILYILTNHHVKELQKILGKNKVTTLHTVTNSTFFVPLHDECVGLSRTFGRSLLPIARA